MCECVCCTHTCVCVRACVCVCVCVVGRGGDVGNSFETEVQSRLVQYEG